MSSSSSAQRIERRVASRRPTGSSTTNVVPSPGDAVDADAAAVRVDDRLRDVETEPGALDLALERRLRAEEALEEPLALLLGDPDAGVGDLDADELVTRAVRAQRRRGRRAA